MKKLVALVECWHEKTRWPGDAFEADEQDAIIHVALGHARYDDAAPVQTRAMKAEDTPKPTPMPPMPPMPKPVPPQPQPPQKRSYKRRDMRAES